MYYKFLIEKFGHPDLIGSAYMATAIELYDRVVDNRITELYKRVGEKHSCTPSAVERSVRMYILSAINSYSKEEIGEKIHYTFRDDEQLTAKYLIPIIRFAIDTYFSEA